MKWRDNCYGARAYVKSKTNLLEAWNQVDPNEEKAMLALLAEEEEEVSPAPESETEPRINVTNVAAKLPSSELNSLLTGNPGTDADQIPKIRFLQSEPLDKPFWSPREKTRHHKKTWWKNRRRHFYIENGGVLTPYPVK